MLEKVRPVESVHEWWEEGSKMMLRVRHEVLNITTGQRSPGYKETWWWWNNKAQEVIKSKKDAMKMWKHQEGRYSYIQANKAAKKSVAEPNRGNERVVRGAGYTGG